MIPTVYDRLFDHDIYAGFDLDRWPEDRHGWNEVPIPASWDELQPRLIVEVGTWKGASAIKWAERFPEAEVVCIDTWLGSQEMWENKDDPDRYKSLMHVHGFPAVYFTFLANVIRAARQHQITPMPSVSGIGLKMLKDWGFQPDIIYLDAAHDATSVASDIRDALALKPKIICGDDYQGGWPGVMEAVDVAFPDAQKEGVFWWKDFRPGKECCHSEFPCHDCPENG